MFLNTVRKINEKIAYSFIILIPHTILSSLIVNNLALKIDAFIIPDCCPKYCPEKFEIKLDFYCEAHSQNTFSFCPGSLLEFLPCT
ncbi:MAG: hypothetical protein WBN20_14555, partial [Eudoraea sp.]|uniref:hypothetical protein n=1 Tax=Eudoraea sp. TaxID=1979955 RepID=UPI003C709E73